MIIGGWQEKDTLQQPCLSVQIQMLIAAIHSHVSLLQE